MYVGVVTFIPRGWEERARPASGQYHSLVIEVTPKVTKAAQIAAYFCRLYKQPERKLVEKIEGGCEIKEFLKLCRNCEVREM
jgi:hypothetical protein